jgi:hypothetical protein
MFEEDARSSGFCFTLALTHLTFHSKTHFYVSLCSLSIQPWKEPVIHLRWTVAIPKNDKSVPMLNGGSQNMQTNKVVSHLQQIARQVCLNAAARFRWIPKFRDFQFHRSSLLVRASVLFRIKVLWRLVLAKAALVVRGLIGWAAPW